MRLTNVSEKAWEYTRQIKIVDKQKYLELPAV